MLIIDDSADEAAFWSSTHLFEQDPFSFDHCLRHIQTSLNVCDWTRLPHMRQLIARQVENGAFMAGETTLAGTLNAQQQLLCTSRYSAMMAHQAVQAQTTPLRLSPRPAPHPGQRPLRVGLLGADFHHQATAYLMVGMLEALRAHSEWGIELFGYDHGPTDPSALRERTVGALHKMTLVHALDDSQTAQCIADDQIDILLLIKGPGVGRFGVCALRPATVQMFYLYYPGTSGAAYMDYIIADGVVIPPQLEHLYREKVVRLPRCYQPNDRFRPLPRPATRAACGLPEQAFVLANFNQSYKISPETFALWCQILAQVPHAVLWLMGTSAMAQRNLQGAMLMNGIAPERLLFGPPLPSEEHFSRLACADLLLDTHPYGAHTGTSDALWAGLPVLTLAGESFASRVAASLLHSVGLDALVTTTPQAYVSEAVAIAQGQRPLAQWREHLVAQRAQFELFNPEGYARDFAQMLWAHAAPAVVATRHRASPDGQALSP